MQELTSLAGTHSAISDRIRGTSASAARSVARLSSGNRLTRAADDVAAMGVINTMSNRLTSLQAAGRNIAQANSLLQVADGGLQEVEEILQRMNALSVAALSGTYTDTQRFQLDIEFQQLSDEIDRLADTTEFSGVSLLKGFGNPAITQNDSISRTAVLGTSNADTLEGSDAAERFLLRDGDDIVNANGGDDYIDAGSGDDSINAGLGDDIIIVQGGSSESENSTTPVLPITSGLVAQIDASNTGSIIAPGGNITQIDDQSTANNDAFIDYGTAQSGTTTISGLNSLSFDGNGALRLNDAANINLATQNERTVMVSFETGSDITTRQIIYEQGGTVNGFNLYIDGGQLYAGAWKGTGAALDIHLGTAIEENTAYSAGFIFDFGGTNSFTAFLDGEAYAATPIGQNQAGHSGDIGIGGINQDSRFFDGSDGADTGFGFQGEIGEVLNYNTALSGNEAIDVQNYLLSKWGGSRVSDTVIGGLGTDELIIESGEVSLQLEGSGAIASLERIDLTSADEAHSVSVDGTYFTQEIGVEDNIITIDASGNETGITVSAENMSSGQLVHVLSSAGNDTFDGSDSGLIQVDYSLSGQPLEVNLQEGFAIGDGDDTLTNVLGVIGSESRDTITGSDGNDTISGGNGNDIIVDFGLDEGRFVNEGLVHFLDASDEGTVTNSPGTVTLITDSAGTNNVTNDTGTVQSGITSINGLNALTFDGNSWLQIANTPQINTTGQDQRSVFVTFDSGSDISSRQILFEEGGGTNGYSIYIESGNINVGAWRNGVFVHFLSTEINANQFYTAGFSFDSTNLQSFTGYLDGEAFGSISETNAQAAHGGGIGVGGMNNASRVPSGTLSGDGFGFEGSMGELLIYNNGLDATEAADLSNFLMNRRSSVGGNDVLSGGEGNDTIEGGDGNDTIDGGLGFDIARYSGNRSDYLLSEDDNGNTIVQTKAGRGNDGRDVLTDIDVIEFADARVSLRPQDYPKGNFDLSFQTGASVDEILTVELPDVRTETLFSGEFIDIRSEDNARYASFIVQQAIRSVTNERAIIGAKQASTNILMDANIDAINSQSAARGILADTDITIASTSYALETAQYNISVSVAAQTNTLRREVILNILEDGIAVNPL